MRSTRFYSLVACLLAVVALSACDGGTGANPTDAGVVDSGPPRPAMYVTPSCAQPNEAPFRAVDGGHACARVGADPTSPPCDWPDATGAAMPVVYVRAGTSAGGTGSRDAPFGDIPTALAASPRPATVLLACGTFTLAAPIALVADTTLRGVSAASTLIVAPAGMSAIDVRGVLPPTTATVTLVGMGIRYAESPTTADAAAVTVTGGRATLRMRDVVIEHPGRGVFADQGAVLCGERLTVSGAIGAGIQLTDSAHGYLRAVDVRGNGSAGIVAGRAHLVLSDSLVVDNHYDGIALIGAAIGASCRVDADCHPAAACEGFLGDVAHVQTCAASLQIGSTARFCTSVDTLQNDVILSNTVVGLRVQRVRPSQAEQMQDFGAAVLRLPGPFVHATRLVVADTRIPADGSVGGDGIYVGPGAVFELDLAATMTHDQVGLMSEIVGNRRIGLLVDGDRTTDSTVPNTYRAHGTIDVMGARVGSNGGPGIFLQMLSTGRRVSYSEIADNASLGLAVNTGATLAIIQDDQFINTRVASLGQEGGAAITVGDGLSIAATSGEVMIQDDQFRHNDRVGLLVAGPIRASGTNNTGDGNRYGVAPLAGAALGTVGASIVGPTAPSDLPYAQNGLTRTTSAQ